MILAIPPDLLKSIIVDSISVVTTAIFTSVPAALIFWWTWQRDQERLVVQKLFSEWQTIEGDTVAARDDYGPIVNLVVRNRSLYSVHVSAVGFEIDGEALQLERPMFPARMIRNPDRSSQYAFIADENVDPRELQSQTSVQVEVNPEDRARLNAALLTAAARHSVSVEILLTSRRVNALVALETGKQFTSLPLKWRVIRKLEFWDRPRRSQRVIE